ncbi:MAG: hypothetical protein GX605_12645 [Chloroflexi bacterium]|nr:hypothetical protein [Chloroflexota bacterium]
MASTSWSVPARLLAVIDRPVKLFEQIARQPGKGWYAPVLILLVGVSVAALVTAPYAAQEAQRQMERQLASRPPEQAELLAQQMERFGSP